MPKTNKKTAQKIPMILLIEDDRILLRALYLQIQSLGYHVASATDGEMGLQIARRIIPDLIILDLILPKLEGMDVLRALKGDPSLADIPVIIASNLDDKANVGEAKNLGAVDYIVKVNFNFHELDDKIKEYIK